MPGETDEEFEMTIEVVRKIRFDLIYSFKYSPRPGTRAANYPGHLSESVKSERLKILLEIQVQTIQQIIYIRPIVVKLLIGMTIRQ